MKYLDHFITDKITYWEIPTLNEYGVYTFITPKEISCQVSDVTKDYILEDGETFISRAKILATDNTISQGCWVYLGLLSDLSEAEKLNPRLRKDTFQIRIGNAVKLLDTKEKIKVLWV